MTWIAAEYMPTSTRKLIVSVPLIRVLEAIVRTTSVKTVGAADLLARSIEETMENECLRATSAGVSKGDQESARLIAAFGTEHSAQVRALCRVLTKIGTPENRSTTAFNN